MYRDCASVVLYQHPLLMGGYLVRTVPTPEKGAVELGQQLYSVYRRYNCTPVVCTSVTYDTNVISSLVIDRYIAEYTSSLIWTTEQEYCNQLACFVNVMVPNFINGHIQTQRALVAQQEAQRQAIVAYQEQQEFMYGIGLRNVFLNVLNACS
jgi:hypothetical protein